MLRRLRASLANPSSISDYKNDNLFLVLLYMIVFCFLATLPVLITSVKTKGTSYTTKYQVRELLVENRDNVIKGGISENTLTITNEVEGFILGDTIGIILPTDQTNPAMLLQERIYYAAKLTDHNVEIYFLGNKVKSYTYTDLGLDEMNFDFLYNNDYKTRTANFERLESAYDKITVDMKPYWVTLNVLAEFFRVFAFAFIIDIICALLMRGLKGLNFKEALVIVIYAFMMEIVGQVIDALYGFTLFSYIGIAIGLIYFVIAIRSVKIDKKEELM